MKIPLLDLRAQYRQIKAEVRAALDEVLEEQRFILGPRVEALEEAIAAYCGCAYGVGVSSGTDALLVSLMAAGIGPGQGVVTTAFSFFATAGSIVRSGARPFFVDIDPATCNIAPAAVEAFIEQECKVEAGDGQLVHRRSGLRVTALMPVHLYGQCADMEPLLALAGRYRLLVIEDAAQAIGARCPSREAGSGRRAGSMGECGCLSFFPTKNLGGFGDGGMVLTSNRELAEKLRILRVHGARPKYYHRLVGGNFRLDALQAAVLLVKLKYLDDWTARRRQNAAAYNSLLQQSGLIDKGFITPPRAVWEHGLGDGDSNRQSQIDNRPYYFHIYNQYVVRARRRDELRAFLAAEGIGAEVYYPLALHQQECFAGLGYRQGDFAESEQAAAETLALPIYPELTSEQLEFVVEKIKQFYGKRV